MDRSDFRMGGLRQRLAMAFAAAALAVVIGSPLIRAAPAENPQIASRRAAARTDFSDDEIKDGFLKIALRAELQFDRRDERIRKFDQPVRIFALDRGGPDRRAVLAGIVADIRAHVDHLDLAMTDDRRAANFVVTLVRQRDVARTIRAYYGSARANRIERALKPQCLSGIAKDRSDRITHAEAILPADVDDFGFYDCAYEELLQGLGVINDDGSVPWTMFNDDVQMGFFDIYDQYLVNILYDPRLRPGMSRGEVNEVLPQVLPAVRASVARTNALPDSQTK